MTESDKLNEKALQKCIDQVLIYNPTLERRDSRVRACYVEWRRKYGPPERCDNEEGNCRFFNEPLIWNGKKLIVIVDHKSGNFRDSRPENLQFLCPNCAIQLTTHGGRNIGQVVFSLLESYGLKTGEIHLLLSDSMNDTLRPESALVDAVEMEQGESSMNTDVS